jgi:hypothetical protein
MNERIINQSTRAYEEDWVVLSTDMHSVIFSGKDFEECARWLRAQCPTCEDSHEDG